MRTAEVVRTKYPDLPIYARARNRAHAHRLLDLGVTHLQRETFLSSLDVTRELLMGLGFSEREAGRITSTFRKHDERRLIEDYKLATDLEKLRSAPAATQRPSRSCLRRMPRKRRAKRRPRGRRRRPSEADHLRRACGARLRVSHRGVSAGADQSALARAHRERRRHGGQRGRHDRAARRTGGTVEPHRRRQRGPAHPRLSRARRGSISAMCAPTRARALRPRRSSSTARASGSSSASAITPCRWMRAGCRSSASRARPRSERPPLGRRHAAAFGAAREAGVPTLLDADLGGGGFSRRSSASPTTRSSRDRRSIDFASGAGDDAERTRTRPRAGRRMPA